MQEAGVTDLNKPESGSYGAKKELEDLKSALPGTTQGQGGGRPLPPVSEQPRPVPDVGGRPVTGAAVPPGLPSILAAPTQDPATPVNTPLQQGPVQPQTPEQARLLWLDQLANDPSVSVTTREWAMALRDRLLQGMR